MRTLIVTGFPNVGKSSFVNKVRLRNVVSLHDPLSIDCGYLGHTNVKLQSRCSCHSYVSICMSCCRANTHTHAGIKMERAAMPTERHTLTYIYIYILAYTRTHTHTPWSRVVGPGDTGGRGGSAVCLHHKVALRWTRRLQLPSLAGTDHVVIVRETSIPLRASE